MHELRCPACNTLAGKIVFGLVEMKCRKCGHTFKQRVDVNESVNIMRQPIVSNDQKPPLPG